MYIVSDGRMPIDLFLSDMLLINSKNYNPTAVFLYLGFIPDGPYHFD